MDDDAAAGDPRAARAIRCAGSWSPSSGAATGASASSSSSSASRRTSSRTTSRSCGRPASSRARRSSADGRDVYYRADLMRCRDLLGDAGRVAAPGPRARAGAADGTRPTTGRDPAAVPVHRQQRPLADRRGPRRAPIGGHRRSPQRRQPPQAAAPERGAGDGRAGHRHRRPTPRSRSTASPAPASTGSSRCATRCARSAPSSRGRRSPPTGASPTLPPPAPPTRRRTPPSSTSPTRSTTASTLLLADLRTRPRERTHHG